MRAEPTDPEGVRVAAGPAEPDHPLAVTRRGFFARVSLGALAVFATVVAAPDVARAGRPQPPPCRMRCQPISRTGCACGGFLYRCSGCATSFHACITGKPFRWICLRRSC
jgi:hypothetical protein